MNELQGVLFALLIFCTGDCPNPGTTDIIAFQSEDECKKAKEYMDGRFISANVHHACIPVTIWPKDRDYVSAAKRIYK